MLPPSHVAYTATACDLLSNRFPQLNELDYRLLALAAMGPDLIDKPLAWLYFYRRYGSAVLFAHTLIDIDRQRVAGQSIHRVGGLADRFVFGARAATEQPKEPVT